jgi:hypothetical protein
MVVYEDPAAGMKLSGRLQSDGAVSPEKPFHHVDERRVLLIGENLATLERSAKTLEDRGAKRGESWSFDAPIATAGQDVRTSVPTTSESIQQEQELLKRFAAKVAIEFIAMVLGVSTARFASLDPIRSFARYGGNKSEVVIELNSIGDVWLPKTRWTLRGIADASEADIDGGPGFVSSSPDVPPSGVPVLDEMEHVVCLLNDSRGPRFEMGLFSVIAVRLWLPSDVPLPMPSQLCSSVQLRSTAT